MNQATYTGRVRSPYVKLTLLLCAEKNQLKWSGHLVKHASWASSIGGLTVRRPGVDSKCTGETVYCNSSGLETRWDPQKELENVSGETDVWTVLLNMLPLWNLA